MIPVEIQPNPIRREVRSTEDIQYRDTIKSSRGMTKGGAKSLLNEIRSTFLTCTIQEEILGGEFLANQLSEDCPLKLS